MNRTGNPGVEDLMALLAANAAEIALKAEKEALAQRIFMLEEEMTLARLHRFAPRSEMRVDRVFNEAEQITCENEVEGDDIAPVDLPDTGLRSGETKQGKKRGRRPLPENLPRERIEYELPDDQKMCPCCSRKMHRMGEAVTEQLHIEVKAKVLQNARAKYACRHCDRTGINTPIVIAPIPAQPLPGSIATASTMAFALVHKYADGTPLYRLAKAFERAGVPVSRGALGHWVIASSEKHLSRIYDALKLRLRSQSLIHGDETTVQVLKEDRAATDTSYMCWGGRPPNGIETCQSESLRSQTKGAVREKDYSHWDGYVKACLSTARCKRRRGAGFAQEDAPQGDGRFLYRLSADRDRHRSLRRFPPLGPTVDIARA